MSNMVKGRLTEKTERGVDGYIIFYGENCLIIYDTIKGRIMEGSKVVVWENWREFADLAQKLLWVETGLNCFKAPPQ